MIRGRKVKSTAKRKSMNRGNLHCGKWVTSCKSNTVLKASNLKAAIENIYNQDVEDMVSAIATMKSVSRKKNA